MQGPGSYTSQFILLSQSFSSTLKFLNYSLSNDLCSDLSYLLKTISFPLYYSREFFDTKGNYFLVKILTPFQDNKYWVVGLFFFFQIHSIFLDIDFISFRLLSILKDDFFYLTLDAFPCRHQ